MARKTSKMGGFTVTEILIVVVLIGFIAFFAALVMRPHYGGGPGLKDACISNLRNIDGAKGQWRIELHKQLTDTPTGSDIQPYLGSGPTGELPFCPNDPKRTFESSYSTKDALTKPTCKIMPTIHVLP